jgi:hypothetical protein
MMPDAKWIFARAALLLLALVALVTWLSFLPGCSVDSQGLSDPSPALARGVPDTGVTEVVTPTSSVDAGNGDTGVGPVARPDATPEIGQARSTDGGASDAGFDSSDIDVPPSECPISATRSLSVCTATTQLCRYYDTGAPVLMTGCTAEGRLCVQTCN